MRGRDIIALLGAPLIARPLAARANGGAVIGYLHSFSQRSNVPYLAFFREGLSDIGFIEGQNLAIEYRWAEGRYDELPALVADLIACKVDLITAGGGDVPARAAKSAPPS